MEALFDQVHHLDGLNRVRTKPMQVLALGPSRSGTESLRTALIGLGYDHTYHGFDAAATPRDTEVWHQLAQKKWQGKPDGDVRITAEDFDEILGHCVAVTDMPAVAFAAELVAAYPDAKVILNTRSDLDAWYQSNLATFGALQRKRGKWIQSWFCADLYWLMKCFHTPFYQFYYHSFQTTGKWVYRQHRAMVRGLVPPQRLLEWTVEDGWEPLCEFLGKEVPDTDFPKGNMPKEFLEKSAQIHAKQEKTAFRNMAVAAGLLAGIVAVLTMFVRGYNTEALWL